MDNRWTTDPSYVDLLRDSFKAGTYYYETSKYEGVYVFPDTFLNDLYRRCFAPTDEYLPVLIIAIFFTILRHTFEVFVCKVN